MRIIFLRENIAEAPNLFLLLDSSVGQKEFAWKGGNCFRSMTGCGGGFGFGKKVVIKNVRKKEISVRTV